MSENLVTYEVDLDNLPELTDKQKAQLSALSLRNENDIDYSDIPPSTEEELKRSVPRRSLYKPNKSTTTVRVDTDILEWLKSYGRGYQTRLNAILRDAMLRSVRSAV